MKFKDKYNISEEFEGLFSFSSEAEELEHDAQMLMFKFLEELESYHGVGTKLKKKELAKAIEKSPSFISQLYSGEKLISLNLLAKIQKAFNISFEIKAKSITADYSDEKHSTKDFNYKSNEGGFWVWKKFPDYSNSAECCENYEKPIHDINAA